MYKAPDYRYLLLIESLKADGVSVDDIAEHLNSQGKKTVNGNPFTGNLVKQYVSRYNGLKVKYGDDVVRFTKPVEEDDDI
jgi:DNA-binding transcriptional MerR regulator